MYVQIMQVSSYDLRLCINGGEGPGVAQDPRPLCIFLKSVGQNILDANLPKISVFREIHHMSDVF